MYFSVQSIASTTFELAALTATRDALERKLHSIQQTVPPGASSPSDLALIAETKRLTALLYLRQRLGNLEILTSHKRLNLQSEPGGGAGEPSHKYQCQLATSIISHITSLPNTPTLLWPLFILGKMTTLDEEQRRFVHERLTSLQKVRNLGSVRSARLDVENTWKRNDLRLDGEAVMNRAGSDYRMWRSGIENGKVISLA